MHALEPAHLNADYRTLRYLKSTHGKCILFQRHDHLNLEVYIDCIRQVAQLIEDPLLDIALSLEEILLLGEVKDRVRLQVVQKHNLEL